MTDRPISFSNPMVQALLPGRKSQTRRMLVPQPPLRANSLSVEVGQAWFCDGTHEKGQPCEEFAYPIKLQYAVGDRLWVKEAWRVPADLDGLSPKEIALKCIDSGYKNPWCPRIMEADGQLLDWDDTWPNQTVGRYRHARFMPRWASRLTLTVTDVRVQRLTAISEDDAQAEGARPAFSYPGWDGVSSVPHYRWGFAELWNSLHGPDAWDTNPWVCRVSFTMQRDNIDAVTP